MRTIFDPYLAATMARHEENYFAIRVMTGASEQQIQEYLMHTVHSSESLRWAVQTGGEEYATLRKLAAGEQ